MARTLGCLVASMTLGAALLDWVQPKHLPAATTRTELMSIVRQGASTVAWRGIQLDPQIVGARTRSHFVISPDGRAYPTASWQNQESVGPEGIVRISLLAAGNSNEVTAEQASKAGELVRALQQECSISNEQIHYDLLAVRTVPDPLPSRHSPAPKATRK